MLNEIVMFVPLLASVTIVYILLQVLSWFDFASTTFRTMKMSNIDFWFHVNVPRTIASILLPPSIILVVINVLSVESHHYPRGMVEMILSLYFVICVSLVQIGVLIMSSPHIDGENVESGLALKIWNEIVEIPHFVAWMVCLGWTESCQYINDIITYHRSPLSSSATVASSAEVKKVAASNASFASPQIGVVATKKVSATQSTTLAQSQVKIVKQNSVSQTPSQKPCPVATTTKVVCVTPKSTQVTKTARSTKTGVQFSNVDSRPTSQTAVENTPAVVVSSSSSSLASSAPVVKKERIASHIPSAAPQKSTIVAKVSETVTPQAQALVKTTPIESSIVQVAKETEKKSIVAPASSVPTRRALSPSSSVVQTNVVATPPSPPSSSSSKAAQSNVVASPPSPSPSPSQSSSATSPTLKSTSDGNKVAEQKKTKKVISYAPKVQEYHEVDATSDVRRTASGKKRAMSYTSEGHRILFKHSVDERIAIRKQQTEINRQIVLDLYAQNTYLQNLKGPIPDSEIERDLHRDRMVCESDVGVDGRIARALGLVEEMIAKRVVSEDDSLRPIGRVTPIEKKSCLKKGRSAASSTSTSSSSVSEISTPAKVKKAVGFVEEEPEEFIVPIQDPSRRPYGRDEHCFYRMHPTWKTY